MELGQIIPALIGAIVAIAGVIVTDRRTAAKQSDDKEAGVRQHHLELTKVTLEAEVNRDTLLNDATQQMFDRYQRQLDDLEVRVHSLEEIERKHVQWAILQNVWPPDREIWESL